MPHPIPPFAQCVLSLFDDHVILVRRHFSLFSLESHTLRPVGCASRTNAIGYVVPHCWTHDRRGLVLLELSPTSIRRWLPSGMQEIERQATNVSLQCFGCDGSYYCNAALLGQYEEYLVCINFTFGVVQIFRCDTLARTGPNGLTEHNVAPGGSFSALCADPLNPHDEFIIAISNAHSIELVGCSLSRGIRIWRAPIRGLEAADKVVSASCFISFIDKQTFCICDDRGRLIVFNRLAVKDEQDETRTLYRKNVFVVSYVSPGKYAASACELVHHLDREGNPRLLIGLAVGGLEVFDRATETCVWRPDVGEDPDVCHLISLPRAQWLALKEIEARKKRESSR